MRAWARSSNCWLSHLHTPDQWLPEVGVNAGLSVIRHTVSDAAWPSTILWLEYAVTVPLFTWLHSIKGVSQYFYSGKCSLVLWQMSEKWKIQNGNVCLKWILTRTFKSRKNLRGSFSRSFSALSPPLGFVTHLPDRDSLSCAEADWSLGEIRV